jgi:dimethylaniline monooxygenase (N-oxide forming)
MPSSQFPRHCLGKPIDLNLQRRGEHIKNLLTAYLPATAARRHDEFVIGITRDSFGEMKPEWNIHPPPSIKTHPAMITENFIDCLKDGSIISCPGLRTFSGENEVELLDGTHLEVDAVIFCTGYEANFSIMPDLDPTRATPTSENTKFKAKINSGPIGRLYQNIFDPRYPDSIAWLCYWSFTVGVTPIGDLMSMALAQIWKGNYKFPSEANMNKEIDKHHRWIAKLAEKDTVYGNIVQEGPWQYFLHDAAGTGCNENLGYGLRGWLFWLKNPRWCNLLMTGVDSPHSWRLFDGKRKKWDGAKEAILQANENAKKFIH